MFSVDSTNQIKVPISCAKNQTYQLEMKLVIGQGLDSTNFTVVSVKAIEIKKFCMFMTCAGEER